MANVPTVDQVARPQAHGYDGSIENVLIRLAVSADTPLENITADAAPPKVDTSESGEDIRDETGERYSRSNLSGGAGLDFLHSPARPDDASLRFWDSRGVDVFRTNKGAAYEARLMHTVEELVASSTIKGVAQIDGTVYYLTGTSLYEYNPSGSDTLRATLSAAGKQLIAMGNSLYTNDAVDGIQRFTPAVGWTPASLTDDTGFDKMWAVKKRIVAADDNVLKEISGQYEVQALHFDGAVSGTFTMSYGGGSATSGIAWNASASVLETAINGMAGITGVTSVTVTGNGIHTSPWVITFDDPGNFLMFVIDDSGVTPADGHVIESVTDGFENPIVSTIETGEEFTDVIDVGEVALAFNTTGYVLSLALNDALELTEVAQTKFVDEIPVLAAESFGIVGITTAESTDAGGTVARFYTGGIAGQVLTGLQLVYQIGDRDSTDDFTPTAMAATRDSIYAAIPEAGGNEVTLWRYFTPTAGYARAHSIDPGVAGSVNQMLEIDDRMWVSVLTEGLHAETDDYVVSGYVVGPLADFFTSDPKQWVSGELTGATLPTGTSLELYDTTNPDDIQDSGSDGWLLVTQLKTGSDFAFVNGLVGRNSRYHAGKVVWRSDATRTFSPGFLSYSFKTFPNPERDRLIRLPLNISDQIESPGKRAITIPGRGRAMEDALREFEGRQVLLKLYRPPTEIRGHLEKFEQPITTIPKRGSVGYVMYARIRGRQVSASSAFGSITSGTNLGIGTLGLVQLGTRKEYT